MSRFPDDVELRTGDEETESARSRHSSIQGGPYPRELDGTGFPSCSLYPTKVSEAAIYARSLLSAGQGYPLWSPLGFTGGARPAKHYAQGVGIGDVGYLDPDGDFVYLWNIFQPSTDPIQREDLPRNFCPIEPPLHQWEIRRVPGHYAPGSAIVSEGIQVDQLSSSPLKIRFTTSAHEGGILVLPSGASREDLVTTDQLYEYVRQHAVDWYQSMDEYDMAAEVNVLPNGTLYLVTGTDKTKSWGTASFPRSPRASGKAITIDYSAETRDPWGDTYAAETMYRTEEENRDNICAVVIRGLRVGLSCTTWERNLAIVDPATVSTYCVQSLATSGYRMRFAQMKSRRFKVPDYSLGSHKQISFHPSNLILQLLLEKSPKAIVAIVDDQVWCSAIDARNPTYPELLRLLPRLLKENHVVSFNGIVMLVPLSHKLGDAMKIENDEKPLTGLTKFIALVLPDFVRKVLDARTARIYIQRTVEFLKL